MSDPQLITDLARLGATAWASKELAGKLLGPTFDYVGGEVRQFAEKCNVNLTDVFQRARRKLGRKLDEPGGVSPRVLNDVLDQGAFCDEPIAAEYVAGVLAASRSVDSREDRGIGYLSTIRQMSRHELRLHYLIYWSMNSLLKGEDLSALNRSDIARMRLFLPMHFLRQNCELTGDEHVVVQHAFTGLTRHDLINEMWWGGDESIVREHERTIRDAGYFVAPSPFGVELFLWAHGYSDVYVGDFLSDEVRIAPLPDLPVSGSAVHSPDRSAEMERHRRATEAFIQRTLAARRRGL